CVILGDLGVERVLLGVHSLANPLDVLVPIALDLVPLTLGAVGNLLRLGARHRSALVGLLASVVDHGLQLRLILCGSCPNALVGLVDLLPELGEIVWKRHSRGLLWLVDSFCVSDFHVPRSESAL